MELRLDKTIFYTIEKAIKSYRQYAQKQINEHMKEKAITIDQWLVLKTIMDHEGISQKELAKKVFKDEASIARIIELLVKRNYLEKTVMKTDRRRYDIKLSSLAEETVEQLYQVVDQNRQSALKDLESEEIEQLSQSLIKIIGNCNS